MATDDWFDVRGAVAWVTEQTMDKTIGMTRFWEQKYWLSDFSAEFAMAGIIFVVTMLAVSVSYTHLPLPPSDLV